MIHHAHKLRSRSPLLAHEVLVLLLTERLLDAEEQIGWRKCWSL